MDTALEFHQVSVTYRIPEERRALSLKTWAIQRLTQRVRVRTVRALQDVSFKLAPGQTLGVIGHNGAGKSTLLRVAAGIIRPSHGHSIARGRLAPIIELGTGFEHELNGRENIFFNGALLGRSRREMQARFDEIVAFSGLEEFIDSPLRTYSTGMVARLAFAVATAVDPDLLLLDEVLSVGDEEFRTRCHDRIESFRSGGATILLVSHDLQAVQSLCGEALWLKHGLIQARGPADEVVAAYTASVAGRATATAPAQPVPEAAHSPG